MTVDGAAKRLGLLSIIKPFTVLVEETACELKPHIVVYHEFSYIKQLVVDELLQSFLCS